MSGTLDVPLGVAIEEVSMEPDAPGFTSAAAGRPRSRRRAKDAGIRPVGAKTAVLHARRMRACIHTGHTEPSQQSDQKLKQLRSLDGAIGFRLAAFGTGLCVERTDRRRSNAVCMQAMVFDSRTSFLRWCDSEPIRFEEPLLFDHLRRLGGEALDGGS